MGFVSPYSVLLFSVLLFSIACGKVPQKETSSPQMTPKPGDKETCELNGEYVSCDSLEGADGYGVDLLESMIDVPVSINNSIITFLEDKQSFSQGRRITCETSVRSGEVYRLSDKGDHLLVMTSKGNYKMKRVSGENGLYGAWAWKGYIDRGTHVIKNLTILDDNRVVMRSSCEL